MDAVLALLIALGVFVPCVLFGARSLRSGSDPERAEPHPVAGEAGADRDRAPAGSGSTVNLTITQRVTHLALTSIRNTFGGSRPELPPGESAPPPGGSGWDDPDLDDIDDILGDHPPAGGTQDPPRRPLWGDIEVVRDRPSGDALPPVDRIERSGRDALPPGRGQARSDVEDVQTGGGGVALAPAPPVARDVAGMPVAVDEPLTLEGVDMSHAPIVPSTDGNAVRLPSVQQMQAALATGGFERLLSWLRAFRKASSTTLSQAENLHGDAMAIARRTRTKYALALQAFQAVQADRLDRQTIQRVFLMLEQAQREAVAAAATTRQTAALVVAAGGSQPTVAAAITTLQRNHGAIAVAVKASPQPVPNIGWYKQ